MRKFLIPLLFISTSISAQNYEPPRQTLRLDMGMFQFASINKLGPYLNVSYEYSFMDHFGAEATLSTAARNNPNILGTHASRYGVNLNLIGRLYGLKSPYDVKIIAGARYGSHFATSLYEENGYVVADPEKTSTRTGFSPILGLGYEQRLHEWLFTFEFKMPIEASSSLLSSVALGLGYRF